MFESPLVLHVSQRVQNLASHSQERAVVEVVGVDETDQEFKIIEEGDDGSYETQRSRADPGVCPGRISKEHTEVLCDVDLSLPAELRQVQIDYIMKSRVDQPLNSGVDPFGAFELPQTSTTDMALHHWANVFQNTRMPMTPRKDWMKINLSDKTLLSVTSYCSASHFYFIRRQRPPLPCLIQKANAIRNINNQLRKPGIIPSDYLIIAVTVMAILECFVGSSTASMMHRQGLELMVKTRGGLEKLGLNGAAQRAISWADTTCAIFQRKKPTLSPFLIPDAGETPIPGRSIGDLDTRLLVLTESKQLSKDMIYIWLRLRYLTEFLADHSSEIDECFWTDKIDCIERQILSLLHSARLAENAAVAFVTAFLNAAFIYVIEELRECPKWTNVCIVLSERIRSGMEMVNFERVQELCPDLLLWTVMLGRSGVSPMGESNRLWYGEMVARLETLAGSVPCMGNVMGLRYFELAEGVRKSSLITDEQRIVEVESN